MHQLRRAKNKLFSVLSAWYECDSSNVSAQSFGYNVYQWCVVPDRYAVHTSPNHLYRNAGFQKVVGVTSTPKTLYPHGCSLHTPVLLRLHGLLLATTNVVAALIVQSSTWASSSASGSKTLNSSTSTGWELSSANRFLFTSCNCRCFF